HESNARCLAGWLGRTPRRRQLGLQVGARMTQAHNAEPGTTNNATTDTGTTDTATTDTATTDNATTDNAATDSSAEVENVLEALRDVVDPELGVNVVDLGLVYGVSVDADRVATLDMTLTSAACPLTDVIEDQTQVALDGLVSDFK